MPTRVFFLLSEADGGEVATASTLAGQLSRHGYRVVMGVADDHAPAVPDSTARELRASGTTVLAWPLRSSFDLSGYRRVLRAVRQEEPHILHAVGRFAVRLSCLLVPGRTRGRTAPRLVASDAAFPGTGLAGWLTVRQLRAADRVIAWTRADEVRYARLRIDPRLVTRLGPAAPEPVSSPDRETALRSLGLPPGSRLVVTSVAGAAVRAGKDAIVAFDMLRYDNRELHLVILGSGSRLASLEQFGRALAFDDYRVHFAEARSDHPVAMARADVVWVVTPRGGVYEALYGMAAGKPVVAWRTPEMEEVVDDGTTGFLVPSGDRAAFAARVRTLLEDRRLAERMGEAGRARVWSHFALAPAAERLARLYDEVAAAAT